MTPDQKRLLAAYDALHYTERPKALLILEIQARNYPKKVDTPKQRLRLVIGGVAA